MTAESSGLVVRAAGLDDVAGIHEVHRSDVSEWRRLDGTRGEFERLSVLERYLNGGPWMSPESCAVYVNELILAATPPIIALRDGRVLGEMELLFGPDRDELGMAVCLSILYVHRAARGQGVGRALVGEAIRRGRALGCRSIETTDPEEGAIPFYRKEGFAPAGEMVTVTVPLGRVATAAEEAETTRGIARGWPGTREVAPVPALRALLPSAALVIGRSRHPALIRQTLLHASDTGRLAIPGTGGLVRAFAFRVSENEYIAFFRGVPLRANAHAGAHVFGPRLSEELVQAVLAIATAAGYGSIDLTVAAGETGLIEATGPRKSHFIWARYL